MLTLVVFGMSGFIFSVNLTDASATKLNGQNTNHFVFATGPVYILVDGSVYPSNAPVQRSGNVYTLTDSISGNSGGIVVQRSNIILDGAGYIVQGTNVASSSGVALSGISNVTVKNTNIRNFGAGIFLYSSYNDSIVDNTVTACSQEGIYFYSSSGNWIVGNIITGPTDEGIRLLLSSGNGIYHNSFINNTYPAVLQASVNTWDNDSIGNYWSDYLAKYPNATEIDSLGIWNTPYVIDANNTDHHPLVNQTIIPELPSFLIMPLMVMATLLAVIIYKKKTGTPEEQ